MNVNRETPIEKILGKRPESNPVHEPEVQAKRSASDYIACLGNDKVSGADKRAALSFQIITKKGMRYRVSYTGLIDCLYDETRDILLIVTTTRNYALSGRGLEVVWDLFCKNGVLRLTQFNEAKHTLPEDHSIVITDIDIIEQA